MRTITHVSLLALVLAPFAAGLAAGPAKPAASPVFDSAAISGLGIRNIGSAAMSGRIASLDAAWDPLESTCRHASLSIL